MTTAVRYPRGRSSWLAAASPLLGVVLLSCRIGYDPLGSNSLVAGGAPSSGGAGTTAGDATIGAGGSAGDSTTSAGGSAGDSTTRVGGSIGGTTGGGANIAGAGGGLGAGGSGGGGGGGGGLGSSGSSGAGCNAAAKCACETFGGHQYWFCGTPSVRADALAVCVSGGMSLVRIDDSGENAWIKDTATSLGLISSTLSPSDLLFTGANDLAQSANWQWADGAEFWSGSSSGSVVGGLYANWASSQPQTSTARRCAGLFFDGSWQSRSCTALQPYVCEGP